ncbi:MAG: hypothetical protein CFE31_02840 [Rhizobiales bacterium PAR1]|nr:MAG: hypothetical protein CFE31_02840 [Rhizobiales bacterium PAR1]
MVKIKRPLKKSLEEVDTHVIFIHGLNGDIEKTWLSGTNSVSEFWPYWLDEELSNVAVWSVGYPAAPIKLRGDSMAVEDRAKSILARLLTETALATGTIILVGHSMGGIIIKEMMRLAHQQANTGTRPDVADFEERIRKAAFIATPHQGSWMSSFGTSVGIASFATKSLTRNNPHLRDLAQWFVDYVTQHKLSVLGLGETQRTLWGTVVPLDSSDIHLPSPAQFLPIDADHCSITAPADRSADVYVHLKKFVSDEPKGHHQRAVEANNLGAIQEAVEEIRQIVAPRAIASPIIDRSVSERVWVMRKARHFNGSKMREQAYEIGQGILAGELQAASADVKAHALAWCSRFLVTTDIEEAERLLAEAQKYPTTEETVLASAFIQTQRGDRPKGVTTASSIVSPLGRSATLFNATNDLSAQDAVAWFYRSGFSFDDLDGDGKYIIIGQLMTAGDAARALEFASRVTDADREHSPCLNYSAAMAHLLSAVPPEKHDSILNHAPFDWANFPLKEDPASLEQLRAARKHFLAAARAADDLQCVDARLAADDLALWLALRDPAEVKTAREQLVHSMSSPADMVRRVPMAVQFGLQLDNAAVDRAIVSLETISGGQSNDALMARLVITLNSNDAKTIADFVGSNRTRLADLVGTTGVAFFEVRALAASDQLLEAQARLNELKASGTATEDEIQSLETSIAEARGQDTVSILEEDFRTTDGLDKLQLLVSRLERLRDWRRLSVYARKLFDRLCDLDSASIYARATYELKDWNGVASFLEGRHDLLSRSDFLQTLLAWSLYRLGQLARAQEVLRPLLTKRNSEHDRSLLVNIAISSGDWESLVAFTESEWISREQRTAMDLLRAGRIATITGAPRAQELVRAAVKKEPENALNLVAAYHLAVTGGWEKDPSVAAWIRTAADHSDGASPIQRMSLDELMEQQPEWQRHENETWDQLVRGEIPLFVAAMRMRRTGVSMLLTPALASLAENDPRRRGLIMTYSGRLSAPPTRQAFQSMAIGETRIALEASALMVLSYLDLLPTVLAAFGRIVIPHSTLRWLLDEHQKVKFHQPSQVADAHEVRNLLAAGNFYVLDAPITPSADLVEEVGDDLAVMLEMARVVRGDSTQNVVVRPGPVHRPASLMKEHADLSSWSDILCGCGDVVLALLRQGQITDEDAARAQAYLALHEVPWSSAPEIQPGATLYLDGLAVSMLQHLNLLEALHLAHFKTFVSRSQVERIDSLIRHEMYAKTTIVHLEQIRTSLAQGIASGKVVLFTEVVSGGDELALIGNHPTAGIFALGSAVDLLVVDDRALNRFSSVDAGERNVPIACTLDLLALLETAGTLTTSRRTEAETRLRRGGFQLMPVRTEELLRLVSSIVVHNGLFQETAHLRSIRESAERLRMTDVLQLPQDQAWFDQLFKAVTDAVRAQWNDDVDDATARVRSGWLLGLLHLGGWSHRFDRANDRDAIIARSRYLSWIILTIPLKMLGDPMKRYSEWMEGMVIQSMASIDPESLEWLVGHISNYIEALAEKLDEEGDHGE